jgi:hypothetical protein
MNRKKFAAAIILLCVWVSSLSWAYNQKEVLRGIKGVKVVVEDISPDIERLGLNKSKIQSNVESQLRKVGIKVLKAFKPPAMTALYINVYVLNPGQSRSVLVYAINIMVYENAYLKREIGSVGDLKEVRAADWYKGMVGIIGVTHTKEIYTKVEEQVNKFISDYLAVNQ